MIGDYKLSRRAEYGPWRLLKINLLYGKQLARSFLPGVTFCLVFLVFGAGLIHLYYNPNAAVEAGAPAQMQTVHRAAGGTPYLESLYYMFFLMLAENAFPQTPHHPVVDLISVLAPLVGIMVVFDLLARFSLHVFSKKTNQREWVNVVASTYRNHLILCGLGRVGSKVFEQLVNLGEEVVCIESNADAMGVRLAQDSGFPVFIDDARRDVVLKQAGIEHARAIVAVTNDDMVNLEIGLDARKFSENIRVIARIFEPQLGRKIQEAFHFEGVYSTSSVAAPFFAVTSLDPEIVNSFYIGDRLFVVVTRTLVKNDPLLDKNVEQAFHEFGFAVVSSSRVKQLRGKTDHKFIVGEEITFQCCYSDFKVYREIEF